MTRRPFAALALAEALSLVGTRLSMVALPWLVLDLTGDPFATGLTAFAEMAPYVLAKGLGGPAIDRFGARRVAIAGDLGALMAAATIPLLATAGLIGLATLLPAVFGLGLMRGPADAAKNALVPGVAEAAGLPLERVTGAFGTIDRLAATLGAGAAGALVALVGPAPALAVTVATFALSALTVARGLPRAPAATAAPGRYLADLAEGWAFFRADTVLVAIVVMVALTNFIDQAFVAVFLPVWAREVGGGSMAFGGLLAIFSGFAVLGAALATLVADRLPRLAVYTGAFLIVGAPRFLVLLPGVPGPVLLAVLILAGLSAGVLNPILSAVIFERIPRPLLGRVTALTSALFWGLMPLGALVGGWAVAALGLSASLALAAGGYFAVTMLPLVLPGFRAFAVRPARAPAA